MTRGPAPSLLQRFGITRVARLTGLDRLGVEVFAAVRPAGHVLQVSQGKGRSAQAARWSAVSEAIELAAAETVDDARLWFGEAPRDALFDAGGLSIAWVRGRSIASGTALSVPAELVYCPPAGRRWFGPSLYRWQSNGLGAHPRSRAHAERHALLELLERDAIARVLPHGWTAAGARRRLVTAPGWTAGFASRGFRCFTFDLTPPGWPVRVAGALLFDVEADVVPLTAGYCCRATWAAAVDGAVLEAAQSRLTEIHGAREDVLHGTRAHGAELLTALAKARPASPTAGRGGSLARWVDPRVAVVELRAAPWVVKAVSPVHQVTELL